ncbi:MAG: hypothetical protein IKY91_09495 [Akkermansia sp.]|nr:hypothetical protein [Akkermansia sp.]
MFVLLVFLAGALIWLLSSFVFIPLGKLAYRLWKDAKDAMTTEDINDEKEINE